MQCTRLRVTFREKLPQGTLPQHVRKVCLGIVEDTHPAWDTVCNHRLIYPRLHFNLPGKDSFFFTGIGDRGSLAVAALMEAFQSRPVVLGNQPLTLADMGMRRQDIELRTISGLIAYTLRTPMHMFLHGRRIAERTGDLAKDYQDALKRHFGWLFGQFGLTPGVPFRVYVQDVHENFLRVKEGLKLCPAMARGRIVTNVALPPAVGHGVGLGWGCLRKLDNKQAYAR